MFNIFRRSILSYLTPSRTYIIWDCKLDKLLRKLRPFLDSDYKCILFTRHSPRFISLKNHNLNVIWVSTEKTESSIPPKHEYVMRSFDDFIKNHDKGSIIILDVFDYLATPTDEDFNSTLAMLRLMIDKTAISGCVLLVTVCSKSFDEKKRAWIMRSGAEMIQSKLF